MTETVATGDAPTRGNPTGKRLNPNTRGSTSASKRITGTSVTPTPGNAKRLFFCRFDLATRWRTGVVRGSTTRGRRLIGAGKGCILCSGRDNGTDARRAGNGVGVGACADVGGDAAAGST